MTNRIDLSPLGNLVVTLTLLLLVAIGLPSLDFFGQTMNYLPLHGAMETASIVAMFAVLAIYLRQQKHPQSGSLAVLAAGCLAVGLIDVLHTLSYDTMPALVTPSNPQKAINFWLAGRLMMALTLIAVALAPAQRMSKPRVAGLFAASLALVGMVFWVGIFYEHVLPQTFVKDGGLTGFKISAEIVIALLFVFATWRLSKKGPNRSLHAPDASDLGMNWRMLASAAWIFGMAEAYLCMYSDVTDIFNLAGHIYKVIAATLVFLAVKPIMKAPLAVGGTSGGYSQS